MIKEWSLSLGWIAERAALSCCYGILAARWLQGLVDVPDQNPDLLEAGRVDPLNDVVVSPQGFLAVSYQFPSAILDGWIHDGDDG